MLFLRLIEYGLVVLFVAFIVLQVLVPLLKGKPVFPFFRSKAIKEKEFIAARGETETARIERAIQEERRRAEEIRRKNRRR